MRSGVGCWARGPGDESGATDKIGATVYRRLRHEREAPTTRAHCHEGNRYPRADTAVRPYAESPKPRNWLVNHRVWSNLNRQAILNTNHTICRTRQAVIMRDHDKRNTRFLGNLTHQLEDFRTRTRI